MSTSPERSCYLVTSVGESIISCLRVPELRNGMEYSLPNSLPHRRFLVKKIKMGSWGCYGLDTFLENIYFWKYSV